MAQARPQCYVRANFEWYQNAKRDSSLRRPTLRGTKRKKKSACSVRNDNSRLTRELEDALLMAKISKRTDVSDDEGDAELIVRAYLTECDAAVLESESTT